MFDSVQMSGFSSRLFYLFCYSYFPLFLLCKSKFKHRNFYNSPFFFQFFTIISSQISLHHFQLPPLPLLLKSILDAFKMWLVLLTPPLTDKSFLKIDCLPQSPQIKRQKTLLRNFIGSTIRFDWCDYQILLVWLKAQQIECSSTMGLLNYFCQT